MLKFESLHNHTTDTDGSQTHLELLASAEKHGIGVMAITDHDALPSDQTLKALQAYVGPVKWLIGIELSTGLPKEMGGASHGVLHMLGLFVDPENVALKVHCENLADSRIDRMKRMVKRFNELGLVVTEQDCMDAAGGVNVGNPHMVAAILAHAENHARIDEMVAELKKTAETDEDAKKKYGIMIGDKPDQYPYTLFMKRFSFYPMPQDEISTLPDMDRSVKLIHEAGGTAILAHPYWHFRNLPLDDLEQLLKDGRIDGIEPEVVNDISKRDVSASVKLLIDMAKRTGKIQTFGSDAHSDEDLAAFAASGAAQLSVGQTSRLIERVKPDLSWSNLAD